MPRNLERRVEILFPIENENLRKKIWHILDTELKDTDKAHIMNSKGDFEKIKRKDIAPEERVNSQKIFGDEAANAVKVGNPQNSRVFVPEMKI
jgi:polyphosphate kinase